MRERASGKKLACHPKASGERERARARASRGRAGADRATGDLRQIERQETQGR